MIKITFIYLVQLDDGKQWAFRKKEDAIDLVENKLHMKKVKGTLDVWRVPHCTNEAEIITLELN